MATLQLDGAHVDYDRSGSGPDLLLIHSLLTDRGVFSRIVPALTGNFRVTCLNLPGYGASAPRELQSVPDYADHLARVMSALDMPGDTAVFGNGFGAFVALSLGIRHGAAFGPLIVADVVAAFPEAGRAPFRIMADKVRNGGMAAVLDAAIGRMFPPGFAAANPEEVATRKAALSKADANAFARACLALAGLDLAPSLGSIGNRTLVLCGELDATTPPELARVVAQGIPGARYAGISGSGHCPMVEQPEALLREIRSFLIN